MLTRATDSNFARHAFDTFIPLSVETEARKQVIFDFFDLLAAVAARSKTNGMGGRKLSRMAGWWAFEFSEDGKGFDGGYRTWEKYCALPILTCERTLTRPRAADAASHLFFAYLRSLAPDPNAIGGISSLPRSLQALLSQTEYPPQAPLLMQTTTTRVVMIVGSVSPTPFSLLRRAKNFEYRDDDEALQQFSSYEDTVTALTDECRRVLGCISTANQSVLSPDGARQDPSWSRFEDFGFSGLLDSPTMSTNGTSALNSPREFSSLRAGPRSRNTDFGRPTTPSWADFLSSGFADENNQPSPAPLLLPSDKLPPIGEAARVHSSQSHMRNGLLVEEDLEPGELASISRFDLDDTFWWVWMTSLAGEETSDRKAAFGRCTLIETKIPGAKWLVVEEQVKGASPGPEEGAYIAEKKSKFSWTRRGRLGRRKSTGKKPSGASKEPYNRTTANTPMSKTSIGPDQHARIQAAAARLAQNQRDQQASQQKAQRRARVDDTASTKTNSVLTLQPHLLSEAAAAMKWDKKFGEGATERDALRAKYLGDVSTGRGSRDNLLKTANGSTAALSRDLSNRDLPSLPTEQTEAQGAKFNAPPSPAPLPATPTPEALHSQAAEASTAAQVPLPKPSPLPPGSLDEKPVTQPDYLDQHPALRKPVPDRKHVGAPHTEASASEEPAPAAPTPEPKKPSPKKLHKKKEGGGGFRKLFGKKKVDTAAPAPQRETEEDSRMRELDAARSVSRFEDHVDTPARQPSPTFSLEKPEPVMARAPDVQPSPALSAISHTYREPSLPVAPSPTTHERREAEQAFSRFDQGPMGDMPAFLPEDSDDEDMPTVPRHRPQHVAAPHEQAAPMREAPPPPMDDVSEESVDLSQQASPSQDRWAQIRKNAAERAARLSEEQSRRSQSQSARTDEGETSGEETIESRVARIKARVAELTGNMEGQPPAAGARRY